MEKSIENIWATGFENSKEILNPKKLNLTNQKSKLLLEKIKKTYKTDNKSIIPIAILFAIGFSIAGNILLGFYGMFLMIGLFFFNKKLLKKIEEIKITTSSYDYLIAYKKGVNTIISSTLKLLGFGLPLFVLPGLWLHFRTKEVYISFINEFSSLNILLMILVFAGVISLLGITIYKIVNTVLYKKHLNDLDIIVNDLEVLKMS